MKAIVIRQFGGPDVLQMEDVADPVPGDGEVVLEVYAVSVNRTLDLAVRAGSYARPVALPHVLGADPSGIVIEVGPGVTERKAGDRVVTSPRLKAATATAGPVMLGLQVWGGYAQRIKLPGSVTYRIPDGIDFPNATVVARHGPVAFNLLSDKAKLQPGEWVLVMGAAGGLGSAGVQAAKYLGGNVIAAAGADERVSAAMSLGANAGINYRTQNLSEEVRKITGGTGVNVVFENIGDPDLFPQALASLARHGRLVTAGAHAGRTVPLDLHRVYMNYLSIVGSTDQTPDDVALSLRACAEGRFKPLIGAIMPLASAADAHRMIEQGTIVGKIVLQPQQT